MALEEAKALVAELCAGLYSQGHVSGTGGGISIKVDGKIVMAPSGVQKERMVADDMFVLSERGDVEHSPRARPYPYPPPKLSECAPLFMSVRPWNMSRETRIGMNALTTAQWMWGCGEYKWEVGNRTMQAVHAPLALSLAPRETWRDSTRAASAV